jgi:septum formation protein
LVLASGSPRRRELLEAAGVHAEIMPAPEDAEGDVGEMGDPGALALAAAERKTAAVAKMRTDALVLGADTVVAADDRVLGKPSSPEEARAMLRLLAGRKHAVYTAMVAAAWADGDVRVLARAVAVSEVSFRPLTDEEIEAYVESGEPMDKAGAYGIQGGAAGFVAALTGPWDNVIGLPVSQAMELVAEAERVLARAGEAGWR